MPRQHDVVGAIVITVNQFKRGLSIISIQKEISNAGVAVGLPLIGGLARRTPGQ
jgi:hypothetical protein